MSRLWYVSSFAAGLDSVPLNVSLDVLYSNSDLLNSFLGRPRTTASNRISSKIIAVLHNQGLGQGGSNFDRGKFRLLMKEIDLRSGSINLNALEESDFDAFFEEIFASTYF
ncbi:unannotated protein [freshwater metagenome]|uniref:Unannotated protein n=1 Tax=freshwater metagenome TaxID=449393 RepID=A0A6J6HEA4_9ZZZZ|nr:hypothetical protein [Actinomycetota bacterium]